MLGDKDFKFKAHLLNNYQVKLNVDTELEYRSLTSLINKTDLLWNIYENKQTRAIRVMVRHLHPSCDLEKIASELKNKEFKIQVVNNKIKKLQLMEKKK